MKIFHYKYKTLLLVLMLVGINLTSCKKFIEVKPPATYVNQGNVYNFDGTAIAAVIGIYTTMSNNYFASNLSFYPELSADNMRLLNLTMVHSAGYYQNNLLASDGESVPKPWLFIYPQIFTCNAVIEGLNESKSVSHTVKQNLLGQAYFLRAFFYFYLTNFYGDVPMALSTDFVINNSLKRASSSEVYSQIISDLKQAENFLPENYLTRDMVGTFAIGEEQRIIPNRSAAIALLARVYLYQKDYANAEAAATEVIDNSALYTTAIPLNQVFLNNSSETIWALQQVKSDANTDEAEYFTLRESEPTSSSTNSAYLSEDFMNTFQIGDQRKVVWIDTITTGNVTYPFPAKYKALSYTPLTEQSIFLRLAEQYLIRAESRIEQGRIVDGIADLNVIRDRAIDKAEADENKRLKLWSTALSKEEAIVALNYERRVELFAECGHRWLDLKRTGEITTVMTSATSAKGGTWSAYKAFYPIPADELTHNINLVQNEGYTN